MMIGRGVFAPGTGHDVRGGFTFTQTSDGILMQTSDDFFFDGSPDPAFGLHSGLPTSASDPVLRANMLATRFLNLAGGQVPTQGRKEGLILPQTDFDAFNTVVLWCFRFPFVLAIGPIERVSL